LRDAFIIRTATIATTTERFRLLSKFVGMEAVIGAGI
jgi:hypothetical protein